MTTFKYKLDIEIVVDEDNVHQKYPNYSINYDSIESFADSLFPKDNDVAGIDISKDGLRIWGYSITKKITRIK